MHTITIKQLKSVIEHVAVGLNQPVMLIGRAGVGKTVAIEQVCKAKGYFYHPVLLGQYDTTDVKGTPWVGETDGWQHTVWHPATTLPFVGNPSFPTDRPIVLFLDERTSASPAVLGVCYQLVDKRRVGEHILMPNVHIVSAGNKEDDKGIVTRQPLPLCNRETWFEIAVDVEQWGNWALGQYGHKASNHVAFLSFKKNLMHTYDPGAPKPEKVFASPRTWEKHIIYTLSNLPEDIKDASCAGSIGDGPHAEFLAFCKAVDKFTKIIPAILKDPATAEVPEKPDERYAVCIAVSGEMKVKNLKNFSAYLDRLPPEFAIFAWQVAIKRDNSIMNTAEFIAFAKRWKSLFHD